MHLARVSGASAQGPSQAIAPGGDGDLLAMLLGGTGEASPAFPLTLEAALAGGEPVGDPLAEASEDAPASVDAAAVTLDAALAAALALGGAVAVDPAATPAEGDEAAAAEPAAVGAAIVASVAATAETEAAGVAPAITAGGAGAEAGEPSAAPDASTVSTAASVETADGAKAAEPAEPAEPADARPVAASDAPMQEPARATTVRAAAEHERGPRSAVSAERSTNDGLSPRELAPDAARHVGHAGDADAAPSFEHRDDDARDPDGLARATAATSIDAPAKLTLTVTSPGVAGDTTHVARPDAIEPAATAAAQTSSTGGTTTASHANAPAPADRAPLAHGTIEARWSERVTDAVRLSALRGGGEIRLQLEPEGLGHIDVRLDLHADGVRAVIVAEHESTRALLQSQQQALHDAFGRSDLRLSGFSVDVGSGGAAAFQRGTEGGEGGHAPAAASAPTTTPSSDAGQVSDAPAANGRVNVRV